MKFRKCKFKDWAFLLALRNDQTTRSNSFDQGEINIDMHKEWLKNSLQSPSRKIIILEVDGQPAGIIREDVSLKFRDGIILSWAVSPDFRGKGLGTKILSHIAKNRMETLYAEIKDNNIPSIKMAEKNNFKIYGLVDNCADSKIYKKRGFSEIINEIENVRKANNVKWMDLLRLAFEENPASAKKLFSKINENDNKISSLLSELVE